MIKKFILSLSLFFVMMPVFVNASVNSLVKIGDKYYDDLAEAIANASSTDVITLITDVKLDNTLNINKVININLNGNDITAPSKVFQVQGGFLTVSGKGTIKELEPNYGAIMVVGSNTDTSDKYSGVSIGKDVTLEGWSGIFVNHESSKSYGVVVYLDGKINAVDDINGDKGAGVYVNGNIKHQNGAPVVNISDSAEIISTGNGLYIAGYSVFNIGKAYISGMQSGIGIKAGILNIDGATVISNGEDKTPTEGYNNGIKASGTAIQIESNNGYAGDIELNIEDGTFTSKNSNVIYEYIGRGTSSLVDDINITGGTFVSEANKNVFLLSNSFKSMHDSFISGGKYSSDPSAYLKSGYTTTLNNDLYTVTTSTMKQVDSDNISASNGSNIITTIIVLVVVIILGILAYLNRNRILDLFKK